MNDDLFSYVLEKFKLDPSNQLKEKATKLDKERLMNKLAHVESFIEFAKKFLQSTPPVAFDYLVEGNAVTLSNGDRVRFVPATVPEAEYRMYTGEIPITNKNRSPNLQPSPYYKV